MLKQGDYVYVRGLSVEEREKVIEAFIRNGARRPIWVDRDDYHTRDFLVWDRDGEVYPYETLEDAEGDAKNEVNVEMILNPQSTKEPTGITPEQMDEIKAFIVQTVKDNLNTNVNPQPQIRGVQVDYAVIDDPAANDDVFDEPAIEKWEPEGGKWYVDYDGCSELTHRSEEDSRNFGTERMTEQQADKARDEMRVFNRLLAYRDEFDPDFDFKEAGEGYSVHFDGETHGYSWDEYRTRNIGCVYMSKEVAEELCEKLNSGEVVL